MAASKAAVEKRGEAYPQRYVEPLFDTRTTLAGVFNSLLSTAADFEQSHHRYNKRRLEQ